MNTCQRCCCRALKTICGRNSVQINHGFCSGRAKRTRFINRCALCACRVTVVDPRWYLRLRRTPLFIAVASERPVCCEKIAQERRCFLPWIHRKVGALFWPRLRLLLLTLTAGHCLQTEIPLLTWKAQIWGYK